jgi:type IV pilus assembly protein PilZ
MSKKAATKNPTKDAGKPAKAVDPVSDKSQHQTVDRTDHRVPMQLLVDYKSGGSYLFDFCKDVGAGGVFIETKTPLSAGSEIDLTFTIPDSKETLRTKAKVIWSQGPVTGRSDINVGMGVQFTQFNESQRKMLDDFLSRCGGNPSSGRHSRRAG